MENARFKINVNIDERSLREVYLKHFKMCVEAGVASIMNAYNKVNRYYCGHNEHLLRDILKDEWGFEGFVITDFVFGIRDGKSAIKAGVDIEMPFKWRMKPKKIEKWVKKGEISENLVDEAVLRILRQKLRFETNINPKKYNKADVASDSHIKVALEAARKSIVLLKNENKILPIIEGEVKDIAVIGKLADKENIGDLGSSRVYPPYITTPLEGIKNLVEQNINIIYNDGSKLDNAVDLAEEVDYVIIVVGYTEKEEGEYVFTKGGDRDKLTLKRDDEKLISTLSKINNKCIVIMEGGSAIITEEWRDEVPAIIMAWYPGMEGGTALAEILFGRINPSGKLPCTFPKSQSQLPYFDKDAKFIEYDLYPGYRFLDRYNHEPAFYFGFGLSYTTFSYSNLNIEKEVVSKGEKVSISIDVMNEGERAGEEIVQMYIGYINSSVERPKKELKGFKRISLNKKETKTIKLSLDTSDLAFYDTQNNQWIIEGIKYNVYIGPSSDPRDLLVSSFRIS
jgi:beta-glucosidase